MRIHVINRRFKCPNRSRAFVTRLLDAKAAAASTVAYPWSKTTSHSLISLAGTNSPPDALATSFALPSTCSRAAKEAKIAKATSLHPVGPATRVGTNGEFRHHQTLTGSEYFARCRKASGTLGKYSSGSGSAAIKAAYQDSHRPSWGLCRRASTALMPRSGMWRSLDQVREKAAGVPGGLSGQVWGGTPSPLPAMLRGCQQSSGTTRLQRPPQSRP
jgi:hypothetical protein